MHLENPVFVLLFWPAIRAARLSFRPSGSEVLPHEVRNIAAWPHVRPGRDADATPVKAGVGSSESLRNQG
jgi:hypothetical protein